MISSSYKSGGGKIGNGAGGMTNGGCIKPPNGGKMPANGGAGKFTDVSGQGGKKSNGFAAGAA